MGAHPFLEVICNRSGPDMLLGLIYMVKMLLCFGADNSSSMHADKYFVIILWLDNAPITAEAKYSINFTRSKNKFCLSLHNNGIFLYINGVKIYWFQAKDPQIKLYPLCLGIAKDFTVDNMKKNLT